MRWLSDRILSASLLSNDGDGGKWLKIGYDRFHKFSLKFAQFQAWGENEENFLQAMKKTRDHSVLATLAEKLDAPNAVHLWREVR